ncbi:hypothetical protein [Chryseobacterium indoltheticum]|uniref:hypothetical protein n=1 Tax=Chryseobacterium indoltheticum TaxID=254 RepID=UPI003F49509D
MEITKTEVGCDHIADVGNTHKVTVGDENSVFKMDNTGTIDLTGIKQITLKVGSSVIKITTNKIAITSEEVDINGGGATANLKKKTVIKGTTVDIN